jgi:hypothetical protein
VVWLERKVGGRTSVSIGYSNSLCLQCYSSVSTLGSQLWPMSSHRCTFSSFNVIFPQFLAGRLTLNNALLDEILIQSIMAWSFTFRMILVICLMLTNWFFLTWRLICSYMCENQYDMLWFFQCCNCFIYKLGLFVLQVFATMPSTSTASVDGLKLAKFVHWVCTTAI